jgi:hypothetical protein
MIFIVGDTALAPLIDNHGQTRAIYHQTKLFDMGLEWFPWAISYVRGSQVVRRGVLGDAQMYFQSSYGLVSSSPVTFISGERTVKCRLRAPNGPRR